MYFISGSYLYIMLEPKLLQSQQASYIFFFFFFIKKGQTDQFSRRNSRLNNLFNTVNSHIWVSLHLTVHYQKNVHIRHVQRRWKYCGWKENAVVGQKHCSGRYLQTSERLVLFWSDRMCHARLPEALWSLHLTSWERYCCHHHATCNTTPLHPRACVFFHLCASQHALLLLRVSADAHTAPDTDWESRNAWKMTRVDEKKVTRTKAQNPVSTRITLMTVSVAAATGQSCSSKLRDEGLLEPISRP